MHLHSIMLLLYQRGLGAAPECFPIYIPLCFYFIPMDLYVTYLDCNLHSIMLLLYPNERGICKGMNIFTFHYASTLSKLESMKQTYEGIYIPLCFYFILQGWLASAKQKSIYIPLCFYFINTSTTHTFFSAQFTFHYASTLSLEEDNKSVFEYHLHSIMLLLYRNYCGRSCWRSALFTFHYASTLS